MSTIKLIRIDERLIHGQVVTAWIGESSADVIVIADDAVSSDSLQKELLEMVTPDGIELKVLSVEDAGIYLNDESECDDILLLVKTPYALLELINMGVSISKVNVGNMGPNSERTKYSTTLWLTKDEVSHFTTLITKVDEVSLQVLPSNKAQPIVSLI